MVLIPRWPTPEWVHRPTFEDINLNVDDAQAVVVVPPGQSAEKAKLQLESPYNRGRKVLTFIEAGKTSDKEVWTSQPISSDAEALVIIDDGKWEDSLREAVLKDLLKWAISHPNKPVISVVLTGDNGSLPFGRISFDRVLPDGGTAWYLMNVLLHRATSVAKYWQTRSSNERIKIWMLVGMASLLFAVFSAALTWSLLNQYRVYRTSVYTHNQSAGLALAVNRFWQAPSDKRADEADEVIHMYAQELRAWLARFAGKESLAQQSRTVVVLRRFGSSDIWGLQEVASDNQVEHSILPDKVMKDAQDRVIGIAYCAVAYNAYVYWRGTDNLRDKPTTEKIEAWRGRNNEGETLPVGEFGNSKLTLDEGGCEYRVAENRLSDQQRNRLMCAPIPEGGNEVLGTACISIDIETNALEESEVRDKLARWGLEIVPYLVHTTPRVQQPLPVNP